MRAFRERLKGFEPSTFWVPELVYPGGGPVEGPHDYESCSAV